MKINHSAIALLILLLASPVAMSEQTQEEFLAGFIAGKYHLLGKYLNSEKTYFGKIDLIATEKGIEVQRFIEGNKISGTAAIEKATVDKIDVLRMRFTENNIKYEETCMIDGDLDNYARITCYLYQPGVKTTNPGLEVLFIDHSVN